MYQCKLMCTYYSSNMAVKMKDKEAYKYLVSPFKIDINTSLLGPNESDKES